MLDLGKYMWNGVPTSLQQLGNPKCEKGKQITTAEACEAAGSAGLAAGAGVGSYRTQMNTRVWGGSHQGERKYAPGCYNPSEDFSGISDTGIIGYGDFSQFRGDSPPRYMFGNIRWNDCDDPNLDVRGLDGQRSLEPGCEFDAAPIDGLTTGYAVCEMTEQEWEAELEAWILDEDIGPPKYAVSESPIADSRYTNMVDYVSDFEPTGDGIGNCKVGSYRDKSNLAIDRLWQYWNPKGAEYSALHGSRENVGFNVKYGLIKTKQECKAAIRSLGNQYPTSTFKFYEPYAPAPDGTSWMPANVADRLPTGCNLCGIQALNMPNTVPQYYLTEMNLYCDAWGQAYWVDPTAYTKGASWTDGYVNPICAIESWTISGRTMSYYFDGSIKIDQNLSIGW
jgi:hypothetical protein